MSTCHWPQKQRHATKAEALEHIRSLYRHGRGNPDLNAYPCGNHWHVGHSRVRLAKRIRRVLKGIK